MSTLADAAGDFLAQARIAVVGVSRAGDTAANVIYKKLRGAGHQVFAVNPNAETVENDPSFARLSSIPGGVDAVVVATHPSVSAQIVEECARLGITRVWLHRSVGQGSVSDEAARLARSHGLSVIVGGCPMMFSEPVDVVHRCMRWFMQPARRPADPVR